VEQMKNVLKDRSKKTSTLPNSAHTDSEPEKSKNSTEQPSSSALGQSAPKRSVSTMETKPSTQLASSNDGPTQRGPNHNTSYISNIEQGQEAYHTDPKSDELETQKEISRNLRNIGPVVATLDFDNIDDDEWSDEGAYYDDADADDMENDFGMTNIGNELSPDYIKEMEALMKKHGVRQELNSNDLESALNDTKSGVERGNSTRRFATKGVRFAESLDIASFSDISSSEPPERKSMDAKPLLDTIVERKSPAGEEPTEAPRKKVSRFKAAQQAGNQSQIEPAKEKDMQNEFSLYRERMNTPAQQIDRSLFRDNEEPDISSYEDKPKMSKFKAARLGYVVDSDEN
jgi:hypothetical protein